MYSGQSKNNENATWITGDETNAIIRYYVNSRRLKSKASGGNRKVTNAGRV